MARAKGRVPGTSEVRETLRRQIGDVTRALRAPALSDEAIHSARKKLKSAHANLRVLRDAVAAKTYARENAALRDAARPLSGVRDAKVKIDTLDKLLERSANPSQRALLAKLRVRLRRRLLSERSGIKAAGQAKRSAEALEAAWRRIDRWQIPRKRPAALRRGVQRVYRGARKALKQVEAEGTSESLHELRKQVKYLRGAMDAFQPDDVPALARIAKRADAVARELGNARDLFMLQEEVSAMHPRLSRSSRSLFSEIAVRRSRLESRALKRGKKLFRKKPQAFAQRLPS
jgi:CHAD domain-containing protein